MNYVESQTSIENNGQIIDNVNIEAKIDNFLMDDYNLSTEFSFIFGENINEYIDIDNIHNIELKDLIIRDEENRIVYSGSDKEAFENYCNENGLNYIFGQTNNENYMNCGLNNFPSYHNKESRSVKLMYNMYADGFPKSKKLNFSFGEITITEESNNIENLRNVTLVGNWNIDLDVPEIMYNRMEESYKVISCDNKDFDVYTSKVSDTGFELGVIINNIENPGTLGDLSEDIASMEQTEINKLKESYWKLRIPITVGGHLTDQSQKSYVEDSNGNKYYSTSSPSRKYANDFLDGDKFNFYETFSLTKNLSTKNIKVVLFYYGEPVVIELEK